MEGEGLKFPKCKYDFADDYYDYVTYWGEGDPHADTCPNCDTPLSIREVVTRRWETTLRKPTEGKE